MALIREEKKVKKKTFSFLTATKGCREEKRGSSKQQQQRMVEKKEGIGIFEEDHCRTLKGDRGSLKI